MRDRLEIEEILRDDVQRKTKAFEEAKRNFLAGMFRRSERNPPFRWRTATSENGAPPRLFAMQELAEAVHRFNDFLLNGTIPPDLSGI